MLQIRRAERGDIAWIAALEKETFSLPESEAAFSEMLGKIKVKATKIHSYF